MASKANAVTQRTARPEGRTVWVLFAILSLMILATIAPWFVDQGPNFNGYGGADYRLYMDTTARWLSGGPFYEPAQVAGSYPITFGMILYPPVALWLFVPFTFLPAALWWAVPLGLTAWAIHRLRPRFVVWPLLALCVASPPTIIRLTTGNPVIWAVAALAVGVVTVGPAVFVLLKPSLAPFAFWGARQRRWWAYAAAFALLSLPFGLMWADWLRSVLNAQAGVAYSLQEVPMLLFPVIAWIGRRSG